MKKISVIGLGYVGLPTLVAIDKSKKFEAIGFDIDEKKIKKIKQGKNPIDDEIVAQYLSNNSLNVTTDQNKIDNSDVYIICVPTPIYDDNLPNYEFVLSAAKTVAKHIKKGSHVVLESTVNPGTSEELIIPLINKVANLKAGKDYNLAHCPERINPGDSKWTIYNINRNIGSINSEMNHEIANIYRQFLPEVEINEVSEIKIAESTKILENTYRDVNIALVNEIAKSFDVLGIDIKETVDASANKPFGFMPHWPGCGVGGHCIAVDPYFLIDRAARSGFDHEFLKLAREINNSMPEYTVRKLILTLNKLGIPVKDTKIGLLGLTYKADIADIRQSPALQILWRLEKLYADVTTYDPLVEADTNNLSELVNNSTALVIATNHKEIEKNLLKLLPKSSVKVIIDGRNCLNVGKVKKLGIEYKGIGRQ